jgi:hypothetical protein
VDRIVCCARCGAAGTSTAVIGLGGTYAYLDVCDEHLSDLLRNARPTGVGADEPSSVSSRRAAEAPEDRDTSARRMIGPAENSTDL